MNEFDKQRIKRHVKHAMADVDSLKQQLQVIRQCCEQLAQTMRQIREDSESARLEEVARQQRQQRLKNIKRVV